MQSLRRQGLIHFLALTILAIASCAENDIELENGLYAKIITEKGVIVAELFPDKAPLTVMNFVGLAEGKLDFASRKGAFYRGLTFHRVIKKFMIQGGDPEGNGAGGPGYTFPDETDNGLVFDSPGILAMANAGPDTNGSQFFITHAPAEHLNWMHSIFGRVVRGQDIVDSIEEGDIIKRLTILRVGPEAQKYEASSSAFRKIEKTLLAERSAAKEERDRDVLNKIANRWPEAVPAVRDDKTGIFKIIEAEGAGGEPTVGTRVSIHYIGTLLEETPFDSSRDQNETMKLAVGSDQFLSGWFAPIMGMKKGERSIVIIPPERGYDLWRNGPLPSHSWLVFDVEVLDF